MSEKTIIPEFRPFVTMRCLHADGSEMLIECFLRKRGSIKICINGTYFTTKRPFEFWKWIQCGSLQISTSPEQHKWIR